MLPLERLTCFYSEVQRVYARACCSSAGCSTLILFPFGFSLPRDTNSSDFALAAKVQTLLVKAIVQVLDPNCTWLLRSHCTYVKQMKSDWLIFFFTLNATPSNHFNMFKCRVNGISAILLKWICAPAAKTSLTRSFTLNRREIFFFFLLRCSGLMIEGWKGADFHLPAVWICFGWKEEDGLGKRQL